VATTLNPAAPNPKVQGSEGAKKCGTWPGDRENMTDMPRQGRRKCVCPKIFCRPAGAPGFLGPRPRARLARRGDCPSAAPWLKMPDLQSAAPRRTLRFFRRTCRPCLAGLSLSTDHPPFLKRRMASIAYAGGAAGGAAGWPVRSKPPSPRQFWHLPLPCGKQFVQGFPFCSANLPSPWQTWHKPVPLQ
jgi:hypothetical protein